MITYGSEITPEEYLELRRKVGWFDFPVEEAQTGINNSYMVIVDPEYQGQGIGRIFVEKCIQRIKDDMKPGYKVKFNLMAAGGKEPFYEKFGFRARPYDHCGAGMDQWIEL